MLLLAIRLGASMVVAFFVTGALVFPLVDETSLVRVLFTLGVAALLYGLESVARLGHIETCGMLSGNCSDTHLRLLGCLIWGALFAGWPWLLRRRSRPVAALADDGDDDAARAGTSTLEIALALGAVLVAVGWLGKAGLGLEKQGQAARAAASAERVTRVAPTPLPTPAARAAPGTHGLTFGLTAPDLPAAGALVEMGCHGRPAPADHPHVGSCNPYEGDTSCRAALPIACTQPGAPPQLGATSPVAGTSLTSLETSSARCAAELGPGWRMASFHDAGGWQFSGQRARGLQPAARYWVAIRDQPGNCWSRP